MLQEFLDANLFLVSDDSHFNKMKKAAGEIAKKLAKNRTKVRTYTLIAIDPNVLADNSEIIEVRKIITKFWKTFSANTKDTPVTIIRAVMLEALEIVSKDIDFACLIWLSGRNIYRYLNILGKEKQIISNFLLSLGTQMERLAIQNWLLPSNTVIKGKNIKLEEIKSSSIDRNTLRKRIVHASGPTDVDGETPYKDPNPMWPNNNDDWVHQFVPRMAEGISYVVDTAMKAQVEEFSSRQNQIQEGINEVLVEAQKEVLEMSSMLEMRTQLLWWKEARYSASLGQSYQEVKAELLQILLGVDYSNLVPVVFPKSADYFLLATHNGIATTKNKDTTIAVLLEKIKSINTELKVIFLESEIKGSRISLVEFIKGFIWGKHDISEFKELVGITESSRITLADFTLWIFHDLHSIKSASKK